MKKIIALILCAVMLVSVVGCGSKETKEPTENEQSVAADTNHSLIALESENYKITNGMLSYLYLSGFYNAYGAYSSYFDSMGLDKSKPLDEQQYSEDMTWHDYFLEMTLGDAGRFLQFAEAARAAGISDEDLDKRVDEQIQKTITQGGVTIEEYITKMFGNTLDEKDLRDALKLQIYAYEYYEKVQADIGASITDTDCETYYNENVKLYSKVDYISYTVTANTAGTEDTEAAYAKAKSDAEALVTEATAKGVEGYKSWVKSYMTAQNSSSQTPMADDALAAQIDKTLAGTKDAGYTQGNEVSEFCFEDGRKIGDSKLVDNGSGSYTVYILTAAPHRAEGATKNVRHILLRPESYKDAAEAKAKAEEVLNEWRNGEATAESFDALAKKYNEDGSSLYENVREGEMVQTFNDWLFDNARQIGDSDIVETDYGYHIMYFAGEGSAVWQAEVKNAILSARVGERMTEYETTYGASVKENKESIDKLPTTVPQTAFESSTTNVY